MKALKKIMTPARTIGAIALVGALALGACGSSGLASSRHAAATATAAAAGSNGDTTAPPHGERRAGGQRGGLARGRQRLEGLRRR